MEYPRNQHPLIYSWIIVISVFSLWLAYQNQLIF
jgi:hypothetical protein